MTPVIRGALAALAVSIAGVAWAAAQATPAATTPANASQPAGTQSAAPQTVAPRPPVQAAPAPPRFVVVIDAAHGGDDMGGHLSDGQYEKAATLALGVRLKSMLGARGIPVVMTREGDQSLNMDQRAAIANRANAQACISLHVAETGSGVHLFASILAPTQASRFLPWKTAQSGYVTRSLALTGALNSALQHGSEGVTLARAPLPGVDSMMCPAVAIELAPERDSDKKVTAEPDNADYQARIAGILANALLEWRSEAGSLGVRP
jgi:N-acetylmuramoyl-L-alanine amidase